MDRPEHKEEQTASESQPGSSPKSANVGKEGDRLVTNSSSKIRTVDLTNSPSGSSISTNTDADFKSSKLKTKSINKFSFNSPHLKKRVESGTRLYTPCHKAFT